MEDIQAYRSLARPKRLRSVSGRFWLSGDVIPRDRYVKSVFRKTKESKLALSYVLTKL